MPMRSLHSCVLKWPDDTAVLADLQRWIELVARPDQNILRVGYIGSYARGNWGVGSDLDVVLVLGECRDPWERRSARYDLTALSVPVDLLIYTQVEWERISGSESTSRFGRELSLAKWVFIRAA